MGVSADAIRQVIVGRPAEIFKRCDIREQVLVAMQMSFPTLTHFRRLLIDTVF